MTSAEKLIERLKLEPHPEGGWYRETWRAPTDDGKRANSTAILFLLQSDERSHWHRVDADEIWLWQAGDALRLSIAADESGPVATTLLGSPDLADYSLHGVVPAGNWQAAEPRPNGPCGFVLVSCVVAPGFEFAGFELAPEGWQPGN